MKIRGFKLFADLLNISVFLLGLVYVLDDLLGVIVVKGIMEDLVVYGFFSGMPLAFMMALYGVLKWPEIRFRWYMVIASVLLSLGLALLYLLLHSQV